MKKTDGQGCLEGTLERGKSGDQTGQHHGKKETIAQTAGSVGHAGLRRWMRFRQSIIRAGAPSGDPA
ncbi:hypothetical protein SAMN05421848_0483 [Kushneria avicenniae]|uniref:Uncharacterized protein n=1 Tax=Kushneria avicenniae TaxID=402385 RepID=A0A1I1GAM8_9GAMM|nr:hypothetical protein SAMN05421848_0483 [Kushneria avicenniae]